MADNQVVINPIPEMVFPSTKMETVNKLITEGSLTRLINKLIDTDTYLIAPKDIDFSQVINVDQVGTLVSIPITATTNNDELEFVMHGYYFNLGSVTDIVGQSMTSGNKKLIAEIFVDVTNPEYPELGSQRDAVIDSPEISVNWDNSPTLDAEYRDKSIVNIYTIASKEGEPDEIYTVNYNTTTYALSVTFDDGYDSDTYIVKYVDYSVLINLYVIEETADPEEIVSSVPTSDESFDEIHDRYLIDLAHRHDGAFYFPLQSFAKFNGASIMEIDGGIV